MDEVIRSLRRGGEIFLAAAGPLLAAGAVWLVLCELTGWLLVGPALYGLFAIALAAHEGRRPSPWDMFAALDDVAAPLVAGFLFWLPFALWSALDAATGSVPAVLTLAVVVHFALFVPVFALLVDQRTGPFQAFGAAARLAQARDAGPAPGRVSGLARQLLFGAGLLLVLWGAWQLAPLGFPVLVFAVGPLAVCALTAWYAQRVSPAEQLDPLLVDAATVLEGGPADDSEPEAAPPVGGDEPTRPRRRPSSASRPRGGSRRGAADAGRPGNGHGDLDADA